MFAKSVPEKFKFESYYKSVPEKLKFESDQLWTCPHPPSPLSDPLTCITPRAEDRSPGEEENLYQGFPEDSSPLQLVV